MAKKTYTIEGSIKNPVKPLSRAELEKLTKKKDAKAKAKKK